MEPKALDFAFEGKSVSVDASDPDKLLFRAADVCPHLALDDTRRAMERLADDEKIKKTHQVELNSPPSTEWWITEPGLYALVLGSRKPEAERFKRWVTHEVLPAIRKTGSYGVAVETPEQKLLAGVLWLQQTVEEQRARLAIAEPKAAVHDEFLAGGESVTLRKAAQVLRQGQRDWNAELVEAKYLYRDSADELRPYQKHVDNGLFEVREVRCTDGRWRPTTLVTAAGIAYFARVYAQMSMVLR